jgi:hypothetical protein
MKNQYFGDINDYKKYGLIRSLTQNGVISTAICWMLTPDDDSKDGSKREYLNNPKKHKTHDEKLYNTLVELSKKPDWPNINLFEDSEIMSNTRYFSEIIPEQCCERKRYFKRFFEIAEGVELVFFDPDTGIEKPSLESKSKEATKYLFWEEAAQAYLEGHSLLIYQHFPREKYDDFISRMTNECCKNINAKQTFSFRTGHVVFFLIPQPTYLKIFEKKILQISKNKDNKIICQ